MSEDYAKVDSETSWLRNGLRLCDLEEKHLELEAQRVTLQVDKDAYDEDIFAKCCRHMEKTLRRHEPNDYVRDNCVGGARV